jgi:hypothetical protein
VSYHPIAFALTGLLTIAALTTRQAPEDEPAASSHFAGRWEGTLAVSDARLRIVLRVEPADDGELEAALDSPDQGAFDIPVATVEARGDDIRFDIRALGAVFAGRLDADRKAIEGEWRQSGQVLPLAVRRVEG